MSTGIDRLRDFVADATRRADREGAAGMPGPELLAAFRDLVSHDDWLPADCAVPHAAHYQQYLLHCDPLERFCIVSFVWGPGQRTPVHDHTVWGYVGMLRGEEISQRYARADDGVGYAPVGQPAHLKPGMVEALSPSEGDIHEVRNAHADRVSISVHMYGANIGAVRRSVFDPVSGRAKPFVSGYSAAQLPNIWDRSAHLRSQIDMGK
ncbi:cysteine dioxygenase [Bordetella sp. H567]|uniref:cysteine dioxygenase family protein n=1 Tax=Bordetella sp. H567 TaxID=1697043 RepID=UPI00081C9F27|nr:cysteine dioxygenase [Bordetella sp. H567]AOB31481.1 cysteine dioxygenase [Bordetella sp. H567]